VKLAATCALIAVLALAGARGLREAAGARAPKVIADEPYAPTPDAAPLVALGYRELFADLLFLRLKGYFGGRENTANGVAGLVEAIAALDPQYHRIYEWGARAITLAGRGVDNDAYWRAIAVLEAGAREFPDDWKLPYLEGEIYTQDLQTNDPAERRAWDERGTLLTESAIRKPNAPAEAATWAATMRTRLGQHQRAVDGLREMLLVTSDDAARALAHQARRPRAQQRERARVGAARRAQGVPDGVAGGAPDGTCVDVRADRRAALDALRPGDAGDRRARPRRHADDRAARAARVAAARAARVAAARAARVATLEPLE
jgi:hypothetical protein